MPAGPLSPSPLFHYRAFFMVSGNLTLEQHKKGSTKRGWGNNHQSVTRGQKKYQIFLAEIVFTFVVHFFQDPGVANPTWVVTGSERSGYSSSNSFNPPLRKALNSIFKPPRTSSSMHGWRSHRIGVEDIFLAMQAVACETTHTTKGRYTHRAHIAHSFFLN